MAAGRPVGGWLRRRWTFTQQYYVYVVGPRKFVQCSTTCWVQQCCYSMLTCRPPLSAGDAFRPLADDSTMREAVFPGGGRGAAPNPAAHRAASAASYAPNALRPAQVSSEQAEKSVQMWVLWRCRMAFYIC
jgi:hypothetical protein